jgi:HTH-type transcriptional regulator/antitoxin HipB
MSEFPVRTAGQLPTLLQAFRKQSGLTQADTAKRLGISQQALSNLERHADKVSAGRLLELLSILGVELVLRQDSASPSAASPETSVPPRPAW